MINIFMYQSVNGVEVNWIKSQIQCNHQWFNVYTNDHKIISYWGAATALDIPPGTAVR